MKSANVSFFLCAILRIAPSNSMKLLGELAVATTFELLFQYFSKSSFKVTYANFYLYIKISKDSAPILMKLKIFVHTF